MTITILVFSTSRIVRIDASDPRPTFQSLISNNLSAQQSGVIGSFDSTESVAGPHISPNDTQSSPSLDFHTTVAGGSSSSPATASSPTRARHSESSSSKGETSSDTLIISPAPILSSDHPELRRDSKESSRLFVGIIGRNYSNASISHNARSLREPASDQQNEDRRDFITNMMKHAWHGYAAYAWGFNEVRPQSKLPHTESIFGGEKMGASIVDGIDTLYIMGLKDEYLAAREWIDRQLDFNKYDVDLSVFETNIRYVGGLLSIYALSKDQMFLDKAVQIADKLLPAFDTPSGIPYSNINLRTGFARNHDWAYGAAILSEFGSMHLEFIYLSYATGDPKYREKAFKIRDTIRRATPRDDGLYNNYMNTEKGQWLTRMTHISMGALGDSFYEYLIKAYVQTDGRDVEAYQMYMDAIRAYENKLIFTSTQSQLIYFAELKESINHKMDSLACFSGGMLAMGATKSEEPIRSRHMTLARGIANTCHESCVKARSGLGPETFIFTNKAEAIAYGPTEKYYILRPEILETYFYMWRYTKDPKYREWAWDFAQSLEKFCRAEAGYQGLRNVYQPVIKDDVQQSFFLAEVLKYLYLIFSDDNVINLNDWVFNTEAHPLPILKR